MDYENNNIPKDNWDEQNTVSPQGEAFDGNTPAKPPEQPFTQAFEPPESLENSVSVEPKHETFYDAADGSRASYETQKTSNPTYAYQSGANENLCTYHTATPPEATLHTQTGYEEPSLGEAPVQDAGYQTSYQTYQTVPPEPPKKKKSTGKRVALTLCGVAAAFLLIAAGTIIGSVVGEQDDSAATAAQSSWDASLPSVQISATPDIDPDNYDVVNGLAGEEIYEKVNPSIVSIIALTSAGEASGSGVIMSEDGYVITNEHVIDGASSVTVQLADGTQISADVIGKDTKTDLAVLKVETDIELQAAEFGDSDELKPGEYAYAIGSPGGVTLANTITGGRISAINRDITIDDRVMTLIQTDASINPGNSGGALINKYGQVVGITSAKLGIGAYEGLGFAIPINSAKEIVDELIQTGYIAGRPSIGISGQNISEQKAKYNNVPQGVYVYSIDERAAAASEGLEPYDIITEVEGQTITTMDEINAIKEEKSAGDTLEIRVYRMSTGKFVDLTITLTDEYQLSSEEETVTQTVPSQGDGGYSTYGYDQNPFSYFFGY